MATFENPYTFYGAFRVRQPGGGVQADCGAAEAALTGGGVTLRGAYSLAGFRADADLLLWLVGPSADALQDAVVAFRRTALGRQLDAVWTNIGVHRDAEFNKAHVPAFLEGEAPKRYVCVYPFVRSYEWYLLPPQERSDMLREHGMMARDFADVRANTTSAFALGDYEWLLAFEADELTRIVDLMRHLRAAEARRHTRDELPFYTGIRKPLADVVADLP
ncbi:MAG TPA: hydrogen peroxide-dependent heme synthase [Conexibacter sp.]|nr:hydrogen peroxide-dependent heme synthase [Conexibacter sp.]